MNKLHIFIAGLLFLACVSCKEEKMPKSTEGFPYHYLLNTSDYMLGELKKYGQEKNNFIEVQNIKGTADTNYFKGNQIDWKYYVQPFLDINLCNEKYDSIYHMAQDVNTTTNEVTITYTPVYENLPVQKIVIIMNVLSNAVKSVYAESLHNKTTSSKKQIILYQVGKVIQVINEEDSWFSKAKKTIRYIYFPERTTAEPAATIE